MPSATIKLFLAHGDAKRLRTVELLNWSGKAVAGPRSELDGVLGRDEAEKSGVYFLIGTDPVSEKPEVYVGGAGSIRDRLRGHLDKDFWNRVVFFISKDENLTQTHIRYLEGRLTERIRIDRESEANHDLILWLDEPDGIWAVSYICKYLFSNGGGFSPDWANAFLGRARSFSLRRS